jgi:hypothetical protein
MTKPKPKRRPEDTQLLIERLASIYPRREGTSFPGHQEQGAITHHGPLDGTERAAALAICARARDKADAVLILTVCGLLRGDR